MEKANIGGIKLSSKLVQLHLIDQDCLTSSILPLSHILKENKINMPFVSTVCTDGHFRFTCCISEKDIHSVKAMIGATDTLNQQVRFLHDMGLLSVFPHQSSFNILGRSLCALADADILLNGMASSVSSLTFLIKYTMFDRAVAALMDCLDLPEGYVPLGPELYV